MIVSLMKLRYFKVNGLYGRLMLCNGVPFAQLSQSGRSVYTGRGSPSVRHSSLIEVLWPYCPFLVFNQEEESPGAFVGRLLIL